MLAALALLSLAAAPDAGTAPAAKAVILLAREAEAFDRWAAAKRSDRAAVKGLEGRLKINERMLVAIVLDGYELPRSRQVDLTADIVVTDSTDRVVLDKASAAIARTFDPKAQTAVVLKPLGALLYGVTDPEGVYTVKVTLWDQIRGQSYKAVLQVPVSR